jgi:hypothetical protein
MHILNFSHPLTSEHMAHLTMLLSNPIASIREIKTQLDVSQSLTEQIIKLLDELEISSTDWQSVPYIIVLPSLNYASAVMLAELHGRMGHFPTIIRLRPKIGAIVTEFEIAELINLEAVRQSARTRR